MSREQAQGREKLRNYKFGQANTHSRELGACLQHMLRQRVLEELGKGSQATEVMKRICWGLCRVSCISESHWVDCSEAWKQESPAGTQGALRALCISLLLACFPSLFEFSVFFKKSYLPSLFSNKTFVVTLIRIKNGLAFLADKLQIDPPQNGSGDTGVSPVGLKSENHKNAVFCTLLNMHRLEIYFV